MRSLCLVVPFVLACSTGPSEPPTIRLEGTITAAEDGSPIMGATISAWIPTSLLSDRTLATAETDASGRYSLSFGTEGIFCDYFVGVSANLFQLQTWRGWEISESCFDGVQTLDVQLERLPPESGPADR